METNQYLLHNLIRNSTLTHCAGQQCTCAVIKIHGFYHKSCKYDLGPDTEVTWCPFANLSGRLWRRVPKHSLTSSSECTSAADTSTWTTSQSQQDSLQLRPWWNDEDCSWWRKRISGDEAEPDAECRIPVLSQKPGTNRIYISTLLHLWTLQIQNNSANR